MIFSQGALISIVPIYAVQANNFIVLLTIKIWLVKNTNTERLDLGVAK
ncbi:hypothetical protein [Leuconostoc pseudomesenteroides]|nr:hypothetical protein [Leuconostoc pseudomesenteroides]